MNDVNIKTLIKGLSGLVKSVVLMHQSNGVKLKKRTVGQNLKLRQSRRPILMFIEIIFLKFRFNLNIEKESLDRIFANCTCSKWQPHIGNYYSNQNDEM